jgi:hypothetical protein
MSMIKPDFRAYLAIEIHKAYCRYGGYMEMAMSRTDTY